MDNSDVTLILPREYYSVLSEVFAIGLQRAKIDPILRKELIAWWNAEKDFIEDDLTNTK